MAYLPAYEITELATKADIRRLEDRLDRIEDRIDAINERLDRFFLTQSAGLIAIVGTLVAAVLL
jgi:tetrahydromethanopterin S-methyltransferase subunit G